MLLIVPHPLRTGGVGQKHGCSCGGYVVQVLKERPWVHQVFYHLKAGCPPVFAKGDVNVRKDKVVKV